jgi:hypothetical protein
MFKNVIPTLKYAWLICKHKWFVYKAGRKLKVPIWRLITHDLSKFYPSELPHYGRQFFGTKDDPGGFIKCWLKHQNRNDHHPEFWTPRTGHNRCNPPYPDGCPIAMDESAVKEAIADWLGASRAYEGRWPDVHHWSWFESHFSRIDMHPDTRIMVLDIIKKIWGFVPVDGEDFEVRVSRKPD